MPIRRCLRTATVGKNYFLNECAGTFAKTSGWKPAWRVITTSMGHRGPMLVAGRRYWRGSAAKEFRQSLAEILSLRAGVRAVGRGGVSGLMTEGEVKEV